MNQDFQPTRGAIWEIFYFTSDRVKLDRNFEESFIDSQTREILQDTFNPPPGLSPAEYSELFIRHFMKTRTKSREILDENNRKLTRYRILSQVGNLECLREIEKIKSLDNFHSWENPSIVDFFQSLSKQYLDE